MQSQDRFAGNLPRGKFDIMSELTRPALDLDPTLGDEHGIPANPHALDRTAPLLGARLPGGMDAEVKERGATFSTGEKQLLAFARALAFDPRILVLDEATSSVDTNTELLIQDALHRLMSGRTSVVIAHRLSTIQDVDKIVVLHKGQIREQGSHQELLAAKGIYSRLYQLQYQAQERATRGAAAGDSRPSASL